MQLTKNGWRRCEATEGSFKYMNLEHDNYTVVQTRRDGNCLFHTLVAIAKKLTKVAEGFTQQNMRAKIADHYKQYMSPMHPLGGINFDDCMHYCEDDVLKSFGGEIDIFAFCQIFQVRIETHAPESGAILQYGGDGDGELHLLLHTCCWTSWDGHNGLRHWGGDHWQQLEPKAKQ